MLETDEIRNSVKTEPERLIRAAVGIKLEMWSTDAHGKRIHQSAFTTIISLTGARLAPLVHPLTLNSVVEVQYGLKSCRCQVVWLGKAGTTDEGYIGIRCLDASACPWAELIPSSSGVGTKNSPATISSSLSSPASRREKERHPCNFVARIKRADNPIEDSVRVSDISQTGCYLETMSPLPTGSELTLVVEAHNDHIPLKGTVRTRHPGMGNGVTFTQVSVEAAIKLDALVAGLTGTNSDELKPSLAAAAPSTLLDQLQALIEILDLNPLSRRRNFWSESERTRKDKGCPLLADS